MSNKSQESKPESFEAPGLTGNLYGITVLPENMSQWIDELYKRPVDKAEALEVAEYLIQAELQQAVVSARIDELNYHRNMIEGVVLTREDVNARIAQIKKAKGDTDNE